MTIKKTAAPVLAHRNGQRNEPTQKLIPIVPLLRAAVKFAATLLAVYLLAAAAALPGLSAQCAEPGMQNIASTDVGDLSQVMPVVNFTHGGTAGALHSADFTVTDVDKAYIAPAKMMALTAYHLLKDGAVLARRTVDGFTPVFTRESYIETVRRQG